MMSFKKVDSYRILLCGVVVGSLLCAYNSFMGFRALVVICMALLALGQKYYLVYPVVLFFYTQFGTFMGLSVLRMFSILQIINLLVLYKSRIKMQMKATIFWVFAIYSIYVFTVLLVETVSQSISVWLNLISIVILVNFYLNEEGRIKSFFSVFCVVALLSIPAGLNQTNSMSNQQLIDGKLVIMSRFMGTFDDPNYFTFFCYIAIVSLLTLEIFDKKVRYFLIGVFQITVFSTLSITGIIAGIMIWGTYLVLNGRITLKVLCMILCALLLLFAGYSYALQHPDTPIIGHLALRISEKLNFVNQGDIRKVTTGRSTYSQNHLEYFINQNLGRVLFGGNLANTKIMDVGGMRYAAHNEYIDILLNIGLVGSIVYFVCIFGRVYELVCQKKRDKTKVNYCNCLLMIKFTWFVYAATLTLFLEERFILFVII